MRNSLGQWSVILLVAALWIAGDRLPAFAQARADFRTAHFAVRYDPDKLTKSEAEAAGRLAEQAYRHCAQVFGTEPKGPILLLLTPDFVGATGYTRVRRRDGLEIGIRWADLDYLGLTARYVTTHEVAHAFHMELAGGPLGEGLADYVAGGFGDIQLASWWGPALRRAGLWIEPRALFVTGDYPVSDEIDARARTARYAESALFVKYLVDRFGWARFVAFARDYSNARKTLLSLHERSGTPERWGRRTESPDVAAVEAAVQRRLGLDSRALLSDWKRNMARANKQSPPDPKQVQRLTLAHEIYGAVRNYEGWLMRKRVETAPDSRRAIRAAFTAANKALRSGAFTAARRHLNEAMSRVESLKRPSMVAKQSFGRYGENRGNLFAEQRVLLVTFNAP